MLAPFANAPIALDIGTLFVVATCITALLGLFLLFASMQDRVRALAWWGAAYLIGGFSVAIWSVESVISPPLPVGMANALIFLACGMIWNAARLFHGRPVLWGAMLTGASIWLVACMFEGFALWSAGRIVLSSLIVATYTFLTAAELWRERRRTLLRRWPAIFVPILHGAVFLCPIPLAGLLPSDGGMVTLASGWIAVFALETMLYIVGTAFIVLVLSKERAIRIERDAASTDELTGLLNRRGFYAAAKVMIARQMKNGEPVSVLMFDLDHFKSINDSYGHGVGDDALRLFAVIAATNIRSGDVVARFGGEEFAAILPGNLDDAVVAGDRVRVAFQASATMVAGRTLNATVSIGASCGAIGTDIAALLTSADAALYRAKENGRNRIEGAMAEARPPDWRGASAPADAQGELQWDVPATSQARTPVPAQ